MKESGKYSPKLNLSTFTAGAHMEMSFLNNYDLPVHLCCKYGVNQVLTAAVSLSLTFPVLF